MIRYALVLLAVGCDTAAQTDSDVDTETETQAGCDVDNDGFQAESCGGDDCDDTRDEVHPGAAELCDGIDNDCDGAARWEGDSGDTCANCEADGYWSHIATASDGELRTILVEQTKGVRCTYRESTLAMFTQLDKKDGKVRCVYTATLVPVTSEKPDGNVMNAEHSWPQSEGAELEPAKCDLHHLYPTIARANSARGSLPFGIVNGATNWQDGGSKSNGTTFEPRDDHKGNVARSMLYFALRYQHDLDASQRSLYQDWSESDPVDDTEEQRNKTIARWQSHANPFVSCPFVADAVTN